MNAFTATNPDPVWDDDDDADDYNSAANVQTVIPPSETVLSPTDAGMRLDQVLSMRYPEFSRSRLQSWLQAGQILVNGSPAPAKLRVRGDETLTVSAITLPVESAHNAEAIPLEIVFEDAHLLVLNKPAGLVVHPGHGNHSGTLLNALLHHSPDLATLPRAGIVHRLDKDTTGLMVVAKTLQAQTDLVRQLQARTVSRHYWALVQGLVKLPGTISEPIGRHPHQRTKMAVTPGGRGAVTHFRVVKHFAHATWLACKLETGRTHQIRVHLAHIGFPILGDPVYGPRHPHRDLPPFHRQALHAFSLGLLHPETGEMLEWTAPLPNDFAKLLTQVRSA